MQKRNYRLVFGKDDIRSLSGKNGYVSSDRRDELSLEQWKEDVAAGKRRALTKEEQHDQAVYRSRREIAGRRPMSFERREAFAAEISHKRAKDKIERLRMIKEFSEL
jgi:hypothetical protein